MKKLDGIVVNVYDAGNGFRAFVVTENGHDGKPVHTAVLNLSGYGIWKDTFGTCGDLEEYLDILSGNLDAEKAYYFAELAGIEI